jgi:hypothetical protein
MSKKENPRVSINAFERVAKECFQETITESWFDVSVTMRRSLPLVEAMEFCRDITDACFTGDGNFLPEVMDFAIKRGLLTRYANFSLPENIEKQYWLIYNTDACDFVAQFINAAQFNEIINSANRKLKHMCDSDVLAMRSKMTQFVEMVGKIQTETANLLGGISAEDAQAVLKSMADGKIDESKIVEAYLAQKQVKEAEPEDGNTPGLRLITNDD